MKISQRRYKVFFILAIVFWSKAIFSEVLFSPMIGTQFAILDKEIYFLNTYDNSTIESNLVSLPSLMAGFSITRRMGPFQYADMIREYGIELNYISRKYDSDLQSLGTLDTNFKLLQLNFIYKMGFKIQNDYKYFFQMGIYYDRVLDVDLRLSLGQITSSYFYDFNYFIGYNFGFEFEFPEKYKSLFVKLNYYIDFYNNADKYMNNIWVALQTGIKI